MNKNNILNGNLLVAGGTGLIGSSILRCLSSNKIENVFSPTRQELNLLKYNDFLNYCIQNNIKHMIFAAGKVGGILDNKNNQVNYFLNNTELGLNALKISIEAKLDKVVLFGSSCMYPLDAQQPYKEEDLLKGSIEKTSMGYAISKLVLTQGANLINEDASYKPFFITVIPNSTYGPNDNFNLDTAHVMSALIKKISNAKNQKTPKIKLLGSGLPLREFVYSDDVANAIILLLSNELNQTDNIFNVGSSEEISIKELSKKISKIIGFKGIIEFDKSQPDGAMRKYLDSSKIKSIGWKPTNLLNEGIEKTYGWYIKNNDY